ncbi:MAG TPA: hypothetical protein VF121_11385 [Thermoanaerobaculia bacterium]|nr:hypothetical protein [Thermoanaerobaculia bacterium]
MSERNRTLIEVAAAAVLILIFLAVWGVSRGRAERERERLAAGHETALAEAQRACEARAERLAASEAEAVFRAFAAGIQGSALGRQKGMLDMAKGVLLQLPHVAFVHVLAPDGAVLTSSNEKYAVAGRADGRASWALGARQLQKRRGDLPGTVEIAAPFQGASGRTAVLWMAYKTHELLAAAGAAG